MTTKEKAEELDRICMYENTEIGEFWLKIANMYLYDINYMTDEFHLQLGVEIEVQYQMALDMIDDGELEIDE